MSPPSSAARCGPRKDAMKHKTLRGLQLLLGLLLFAAGSGQTGGLGLVVQQIETIGPRQWLSLMAGSIVFSAPASQRIARAFPPPFVPFADGGVFGRKTARPTPQPTPSGQTMAHPPVPP